MIDLDGRIFLWLHQHLAEGGGLALMCVLTVVGSGWGALLVLPLFASPRTRRFGGSLSAVLAVTAIVVFVLKAIVKRKRPYLVVPDVHPRVFEAPTDFSFPSGHAAGSFAFATFVAVVLLSAEGSRAARIAIGVALLSVALGVGISRCALGVHFPGDVAAGALLGGTAGAIGARLHRRRVT
ncbi:MAG: phosphatase PAP2 family protein [Labilithrix sp.]|nr:phosphatase PAP2 family protein [Labilithrix sp.]